GRGDTVLTLIGNRVEWVLAMVACFRTGAVVLPCTEQLRAKDLSLRLRVTRPRLILADRRNRTELEQASTECEVVYVPDDDLLRDTAPAPAAELAPDDPCLITFTSGTAGEPKAVVHAQRYLSGQHVQAEHWLDDRPGDPRRLRPDRDRPAHRGAARRARPAGLYGPPAARHAPVGRRG